MSLPMSADSPSVSAAPPVAGPNVEPAADAASAADLVDKGAKFAALMARYQEMPQADLTAAPPRSSLQVSSLPTRATDEDGDMDIDTACNTPNTNAASLQSPSDQSSPSRRSESARPEDDWTNTLPPRRVEAVIFLESLMADFLEQLQHANEAVCRTKWPEAFVHLPEETGSASQAITMSLKSRSNGNPRDMTFPDDPGTEPQVPALLRMTRVLYIASVLHEAILSGGIVTKRDIFYRNVSLFGKQRVVDTVWPKADLLTQIIDDIVCSVGMKRHDFCVRAASKGLIAARGLQIHLSSGEILSPSTSTASVIPPTDEIERLEAPEELAWILVVEKDAAMQTLCSAHLLDDNRLGPGVLITGKGYPDLITLQFLRLLTDEFPATPVYALMDADPHGLDILSVYRSGSRANKFSREHQALALGERIQWLGLKATEWAGLGAHDDLLPLSDRDAALALKMCQRDIPQEWRRELAHMLHLNRKAEIQLLCSLPAAELESCLEDVPMSPPKNRLVQYIVSRIAL